MECTLLDQPEGEQTDTERGGAFVAAIAIALWFHMVAAMNQRAKDGAFQGHGGWWRLTFGAFGDESRWSFAGG